MTLLYYLTQHIEKCQKNIAELDSELDKLPKDTESWHSYYRTLTREYGRLSAFKETRGMVETHQVEL
jgi:hypothetical protein